jgi:hypothetical protein
MTFFSRNNLKGIDRVDVAIYISPNWNNDGGVVLHTHIIP